jgi:hypothetical protein
MAWTTSLADLRRLLNDGPTDKLRWRKRILGQMDGVNVSFKTFEMRRVTNFTTATGAAGIYLNNVRVANADIASDDLEVGEFVLVTAPADGDVLEATYYTQHFLDSELNEFLEESRTWIGASAVVDIADGLRPCALSYAGSRAYQKLIMRYSDPMAATYLMQDMPDESRSSFMESMRNAMKDLKKTAEDNRKQFYTRQDQNEQPLFGVVRGVIPKIP